MAVYGCSTCGYRTRDMCAFIDHLKMCKDDSVELGLSYERAPEPIMPKRVNIWHPIHKKRRLSK